MAVSHHTHWPLSDLMALEPDELKFWVGKVAEFIDQQNKAIKKAQDKANADAKSKRR